MKGTLVIACLACSWASAVSAQATQEVSSPASPSGPNPPPDQTSGAWTPGRAAAQEATGDIVVTAQRRSQSLRDVPISIAALSADQLRDKGVSSPEDIQRVVPGFTFTRTNFGTPSYNLRGVGTYDSTLAGTPAVAVYVDETPLPFAIMTENAALDLERIEVVKGPQGILYGQNSTGGAINYIAAKPLDHFGAGMNASYGRFSRFTADGYVTGPISQTLTARLSVRRESGDGWQRSYTRDDRLGAIDKIAARLLLDWDSTSGIRDHVTLLGSRDRSETPATQLIGLRPNQPMFLPPALATYPLAPRDPRAADWTAGDYRRNNNFVQIANRAEVAVAQGMTLIAISSFSHFTEFAPFDPDGVSLSNFPITNSGKITTFDQELRFQGHRSRIDWVLGANYQYAKINELSTVAGDDSSQTLGLNAIFGIPPGSFHFINNQRQNTYAAFGNVDYKITGSLGASLGARYTWARTAFGGCLADGGSGNSARLFQAIYGTSGLNVRIPPGGCLTLNPQAMPSLITDHLREENFSWRANLNWKVRRDALLYASITRGYKAGVFPSLGGSAYVQFRPARQESVLSYEAGFKASFFDRTLQLDGAAFYYDYSNKQLRGRFVDPVFGILEAIINIPKSRVIGAELEGSWKPVTGLTFSGSAAYIDSKVTGTFSNFDPAGNLVSFYGERFPYTSKWQTVGNVEYEHALSSVKGFLSGGLSYRSSSTAAFGGGPLYQLPAYTLFDASIGVRAPDKRWTAQLWARNIGNRYYRTNVIHLVDTIAASVGEPATYGLTVSFTY